MLRATRSVANLLDFYPGEDEEIRCSSPRSVTNLHASEHCPPEKRRRVKPQRRNRHEATGNLGIQFSTGCVPSIPGEIAFLEVSTGFCVKIRGFEETLPAVVSGNAKLTKCSCCATELGSLPDVEFVECPECRFISLAGNKVSYEGGGLGIGINMKKLASGALFKSA